MFSGTSGKVSHIRVTSFTVVASIMFCVVYLTIQNKSFPVLPDSVWVGIIGCLAVKSYQRKNETNPVVTINTSTS